MFVEFARGDFLSEEGEFILDGGVGEVVWNPLGELADVEVGGLAAGGLCQIDGAVDIHGDGDGVFEERFAGDEGSLEAVGRGEGFGCCVADRGQGEEEADALHGWAKYVAWAGGFAKEI